MAGLSKEAVAKAMQEKQARGQGDRPFLERIKGMLNPKSGPGRAAKRQDYLAYAEAEQAEGRAPLAYEDWVAQQR